MAGRPAPRDTIICMILARGGIVVLVDAMGQNHSGRNSAVLVLHPLMKSGILSTIRCRPAPPAPTSLAPPWAVPTGQEMRGDAGERIGCGGAAIRHRLGRGVLLVVGMQDEDLSSASAGHRLIWSPRTALRKTLFTKILGEAKRIFDYK